MGCDRVGIFCFYDRHGQAGRDVCVLLEELKKNVDLLVVVVNGQIDNKDALESCADDIVIRDNRGYDAGAYKRVLFDQKYADMIKSSKELVLCNSSFYGPLIPLADIFDAMEESAADFWGISGFEGDLIEHIQSYFLVFRQKILRGEVFFQYFLKHIQEDTQDYFGVCSSFENGLYECLVDAGYVPDAFVKKISCDNYSNPYGSLAVDGVPVIKKKIFSAQYFEEAKALDVLNFALDHYRYDLGTLLESVEQIYGLTIRQERVKVHIRGPVWTDGFLPLRKKKKEDIKQFIHDHGAVFIYGIGAAGRGIYQTFFSYENNPKLKGFIISDDQESEKATLFGYPIYRLREIEGTVKAVIVGLGDLNSRVVRNYLREWKNVIYKWDGD